MDDLHGADPLQSKKKKGESEAMSVVFSAEEVFSMAMEIEKSGYAYYKTVADNTDDAKLKELFDYLAGEEKRHYAFFEGLSKDVTDLNIGGEELEQLSEYIRATTESRFFIGEDKAIALAKKTDTVKDAVDVAIGFEKDTLLFFYEVQNVTPQKVKKAAGDIIEEEKRHVMRLLDKKRELVGG